MRGFFTLVLFFLLLLQLCSCQEKDKNPNRALQLASYSALKTPSYVIHPERIRQHIGELIRADVDSMQADERTKGYYGSQGGFLWIDRLGVDARADTLLGYLRAVETFGFSAEKFYVSSITSDLRRIRTLTFDDHTNTIDQVLARLEYHLTKAYLRYVNGQRFGFTNPDALFNKLDVHRQDSLSTTYYKLFDVPMQHPHQHFWTAALQKVRHDSVSVYLRSIQPQSKLYQALQHRLSEEVSKAARKKILCNMERARWRVEREPGRLQKYVMVNIPSMQLMAVDKDTTLTMRVGVGTFGTKTPLLTSRIMRMDVNPQWVIPQSIIDKTIVQYAGNRSYFDSRRYFIRERKTGKRVDVSQVSGDMLSSGKYSVIQEGGKGNSMGRIVFRFKNNFAVYLHDTSSRDFFNKANRGVSHGCVRLEKPFEFAVFLLDEKDPKVIERIRYSMSADIHAASQEHDETEKPLPTDTLRTELLIRSVKVAPEIPLFITYYTLYPDENKMIREYKDVYGYDDVIYHYLLNYIR